MSPYARRYSTKTVLRAQELKAAGWSSKRISEIIEKEMGVRPSPTVIRHWCSEKTDRDRERDRKYHRKAWRKRNPPKPQPRLSEDLKLERMAALLERGIDARSIGIVVGMWFGEELTAKQVRKKLGLNVRSQREALERVA